MRAPRTAPALGALAGLAVALVFVAVVTAIASSNTEVWWWPVVAIFGGIGGAVLGSLIGTEAEGESPDEYDSEPTRDA